VAASFTPAGTRLDLTGRADDARAAEDMPDVGYGLAFGPSVQTTPGGRYVRPHDVDRHGRYSRSPHAPWDLLDADGSLAGVLPGAPVDPLASDGAHTDIALTRTGSGNYLSAVRPADATELWSTSEGPRTLGELARTGEVTVVATADNRLTALDLETGRERWAVSLGTDEWSGAHDLHSVVRGAYTDGRVVVVVTPPWGDPDPVWTAYDLATGEVAWTWQPGLGDGIGIAVAGRLVFWDYATLTGLG
jgi:hypothetical protein